MSNSKFKLTGENTNLARVAQMILGPCTNVLRDVLRKEISPSNLETKVRAYITKTKKPLINQHQETLVYSKDYSNFDVTLLYFLLRNMCSIQPHSNKWGNSPNPGDKSVSANIERIRLIRNEYGHNSERSIFDTDFNIKYQYINDIVQELEKYLGSSTKYQDEVKELKTCTMDPTQSEKNIKELLDLYKKIEDISENVKEIKNTVLPWNIKVIYGKDVLKWKEDDIYFVETHNFQAMLDKVRQHPFVTFVGVPGSGKTTTARHIALLLQEKDGYEILPTKDIKDIETYCNPRNPQIFLIDDVFGVFGLDMKELEKLTMYKDRLNEPTMPKSKVLMTCREVVFKHEAFSGSILSNVKQVVQLHSEENALNDQDKYDLFAKYNLDKDLLSADTLSKISKSFPYLCKLFSKKKELRHYGPQFFISPVPCILELLDNMKIRNKVHYASLVLLMTNQNALSEKDFNNKDSTYFDEMKFQVLKRCKVDPTTCSFYFIDAMTEMVGTYTEQNQIGFKFVHDSMLEIVAYHFGRHSPELILQYMESDYIANYIKPDKYKCRKRKREEDKLEQTVNAKEDSDTVANEEIVHDLYIRLQESHYHLLADRLFEDIHKGELFNVFENEALKHPLVLQKFLDVMNSKFYSELFTVFLSELKEQQVKVAKTSKKHIFSSTCYNLLINSRFNYENYDFNTFARAIDWVIFYGHSQILQFIIDQIIKNTKTVNDLFQTPFNIRSDNFRTTAESADLNERYESDIDENSTRRFDVSDDESWSDLCSETESLEDIGTEEVIVEQRRLLNLSCYSGDLLTLQTLLEYLDKDVLMPLSWWESDLFNDYNYDDDDGWNVFDPPIVFASKTGHLSILLELLNRNADVNDKILCNKSLIVACSEGHLDIVIELLKHKANVNITDSNMTTLIDVNNTVFGTSPLISACSNGHLHVVHELLKHGADVNSTVYNNSPLVTACSKGHLDVVLELLKQGADVNFTSAYKSPLIAACSNGHIGILRNLLINGADVNITSPYMSPLIAACLEGHLDILLELLEHGADVNITASNNSPLTAVCSISYILKKQNMLRHGPDVNSTVLNDVYAACSKVQLNMIRELLKYNADVNIKIFETSPLIAACSNTEINIGTVQELLKHGADVNLTVTDRSPLIAACTKGRCDVVSELLEHGADVNIIVFPKSPLIAAVSSMSNSLDIVSELLKHGADVNLTVSENSPLIIACTKGNLNTVLELLKHRADVNMTYLSDSPLIGACSKGHLKIVVELLKHGADVNLTVSDDSPLNAACSKGYFNVINELLNHGADVNIIVSGKSPLSASCLIKYDEMKYNLYNQAAVYDKTKYSSYTLDVFLEVHLETIRKLITHGTDVNGKNCTYSPLVASCSQGHLNIVIELLKHGADVNFTVSTSPLIAACSKGHLNIVCELLKHGADINITVSASSPLIAACSKGHLNIVGELLEHEGNVNITVSDNSPLIAACSKGYLDIISLLLKHGADVNMTVSGNSPLTALCQIDYENEMKDSLSNKAAYAKTPVFDNTYFRLSCSKVHFAIIRKLLKHGADVNLKHCKDSPLNASCSRGHLSIVRELLKHGADVNIIVNDNSPLITAFRNRHFDIVHELLKHDAYVNMTFFDSLPLIDECSCGKTGIVLELLKHGAEVNITSVVNSTRIAVCLEGYFDIALNVFKNSATAKWTISDNSPLIATRSKGHIDIVCEFLKH